MAFSDDQSSAAPPDITAVQLQTSQEALESALQVETTDQTHMQQRAAPGMENEVHNDWEWRLGGSSYMRWTQTYQPFRLA